MTTPPTTRARAKWIAAALTASALAIGLTAALGLLVKGLQDNDGPEPSASTFEPATGTVSGVLTLPPGGSINDGGPCRGWQGYDDIRGGAQVTVSNASGKVLQVGELDDGVLNNEGADYSSRSCEFRFAVADVPTGHRFYRVEVSHRGEMNLPEARAFSGVLSLSLGD
jgi:hypothetical protein